MMSVHQQQNNNLRLCMGYIIVQIMMISRELQSKSQAVTDCSVGACQVLNHNRDTIHMIHVLLRRKKHLHCITLTLLFNEDEVWMRGGGQNRREVNVFKVQALPDRGSILGCLTCQGKATRDRPICIRLITSSKTVRACDERLDWLACWILSDMAV